MQEVVLFEAQDDRHVRTLIEIREHRLFLSGFMGFQNDWLRFLVKET